MSFNFCHRPPAGVTPDAYVDVTMNDALTHPYKEVAEFVISEGLSRMRKSIANFNPDMVELVWIERDVEDKCLFRFYVKARSVVVRGNKEFETSDE